MAVLLPALFIMIIGFVLAMRLDASVYQSIQVYGASFLERGGATCRQCSA